MTRGFDWRRTRESEEARIEFDRQYPRASMLMDGAVGRCRRGYGCLIAFVRLRPGLPAFLRQSDDITDMPPKRLTDGAYRFATSGIDQQLGCDGMDYMVRLAPRIGGYVLTHVTQSGFTHDRHRARFCIEEAALDISICARLSLSIDALLIRCALDHRWPAYKRRPPPGPGYQGAMARLQWPCQPMSREKATYTGVFSPAIQGQAVEIPR